MAEVETTGPATGSEPAPASQTPATAPVQTAQPEGSQDFVQVPRDALKAYGGEWKPALEQAERFRQAQQDGALSLASHLKETYGVTPEQYLNMLMDDSGGGATQTGQPDATPSATDPRDQPLTLRQLEEREAEKAKKDQEKEQAQQRADATKAEQEFGVTAAGEALRFKGEEALPEKSVRATLGEVIWPEMVKRAIRDGLNGRYDLTDRQRDRLATEMAASPTHLQRAKAMMAELWTDLNNEILSVGARHQANIPGATPGGQMGGAGGTPNAADMTPEQEMAYVMAD